jgi:hypothetical protein
MPSIQDHAEAFQIAYSVAQRFLATKNNNPNGSDERRLPDVDIAKKNAKTWYWDDKTPLFEIPLIRGDSDAGSIIASTVKSLPPIALYRTHGATFAQEIRDYLATSGVLDALELVTLYLISPLEPVAKLRHRTSEAITFVTVPDLREYSLPLEHRTLPPIIRDTFPTGRMKRVIDAEWALLEMQAFSRTLLVQDAMRPVKYQQSCDPARRDVDGRSSSSSGNYCTPHRIAGCSPVAWAMMASSMKKAYEVRIWRDVDHWDTDWPSNTNPSQCDAVNQTIWEIHDHIGTTPEGSTDNDHAGEGGNCLTAKFNLPLYDGRPGWKVQSPDMNKIRDLITRLRPVYYDGQGQWPHTWEILAREAGLKDAVSIRGREGHAVVAYGCDMDGYLLQICFGWGYGFSDVSIDLGWYDDAQMIWNMTWG